MKKIQDNQWQIVLPGFDTLMPTATLFVWRAIDGRVNIVAKCWPIGGDKECVTDWLYGEVRNGSGHLPLAVRLDRLYSPSEFSMNAGTTYEKRCSAPMVLGTMQHLWNSTRHALVSPISTLLAWKKVLEGSKTSPIMRASATKRKTRK